MTLLDLGLDLVDAISRRLSPIDAHSLSKTCRDFHVGAQPALSLKKKKHIKALRNEVQRLKASLRRTILKKRDVLGGEMFSIEYVQEDLVSGWEAAPFYGVNRKNIRNCVALYKAIQALRNAGARVRRSPTFDIFITGPFIAWAATLVDTGIYERLHQCESDIMHTILGNMGPDDDPRLINWSEASVRDRIDFIQNMYSQLGPLADLLWHPFIERVFDDLYDSLAAQVPPAHS